SDAPARRTSPLEPSPGRGHTTRRQLLDPNLLPLPDADRHEPAGPLGFLVHRAALDRRLADLLLPRAGAPRLHGGSARWPLLYALGRLHLVRQPRAARQPGHGGSPALPSGGDVRRDAGFPAGRLARGRDGPEPPGGPA